MKTWFILLIPQVGLLLTYVGGMWLAWSQLALATLTLLLPAILLFWLIPESPSFLAASGRLAAMEAALDLLGRGPEKKDPHFLQLLAAAEAPKKRQRDGGEEGSGWNWRQLGQTYAQRSTWQPILISLALMFFSQVGAYSYSKIMHSFSFFTKSRYLTFTVNGIDKGVSQEI